MNVQVLLKEYDKKNWMKFKNKNEMNTSSIQPYLNATQKRWFYFCVYRNDMALVSIWWRPYKQIKMLESQFSFFGNFKSPPDSYTQKNFRCIFKNFKLSSCIFSCHHGSEDISVWLPFVIVWRYFCDEMLFPHLNIVASVNCTFGSASV